MRLHAAVLIAASACSSGGGPRSDHPLGSGDDRGSHPHTKPVALWSFDPQSYFDEGDFHEGSALSKDLVVLGNKPPGGSAGSIGVVGLEVATGAELWRKDTLGWLLHAPHSTDPLYWAPLETVGQFNEVYTKILRLDPRTGTVLATIPLDRKPELDFEVRIIWTRQGAVVISGAGASMTSFDWTTGKTIWTAKIADNAYLFAPAVVGDRIILPGTTNLVVSAIDGTQLAAIPGECCTAIASPDGTHVFVRGAVDATLEIGPDNTVVRHFTGEIEAASDRYYAVQTTTAKPPVVTVYGYDRPDHAVLTLTPRDTDDFYSAIALSGSTLFEFHDADATFAQTDLRSGHREVIDTVGSHLVVSTEVVGTAGAYMGTPPIVERPYLFTEEWGVHGYLIGEE